MFLFQYSTFFCPFTISPHPCAKLDLNTPNLPKCKTVSKKTLFYLNIQGTFVWLYFEVIFSLWRRESTSLLSFLSCIWYENWNCHLIPPAPGAEALRKMLNIMMFRTKQWDLHHFHAVLSSDNSTPAVKCVLRFLSSLKCLPSSVPQHLIKTPLYHLQLCSVLCNHTQKNPFIL